MIPYNLWFKHSDYKIIDYYQNNQHIRTRYYKDLLLTPLINNYSNLSHLKYLEKLSLYQPFYPETFYCMWEFLQLKHLKLGIKKVLHIGREDKLGSLESIILFHEKYQQTYQYNTYHTWLCGKEIFDYKINYCSLWNQILIIYLKLIKLNF